MKAIQSCVMTAAAAMLWAAGALAPRALAATRVSYFSGVTQSHLTRDDSGSGMVRLVCLLSVKNVSDTATQEVTNVTMNVYAGVPGDASVQPVIYKNQLGLSGNPSNRSYRICGSGGCATAAGGAMPTTGAPTVLETRGAGRLDTALYRAAASFQYKSTQTYDDGSTVPPARQNVMFHCSGSVTVRDQSSALAGAAIAAGTLEAVADNYQNPPIKYGVSPFTVTPTSGSRSVSVVDWQGLADRSEGDCATNALTYYSAPCDFAPSATTTDYCSFSTGPGCGNHSHVGPAWTHDTHLTETGAGCLWQPASGTACNFGGTSVAVTDVSTGGSSVPSLVNNIDTTDGGAAAAQTYSAFPQHIMSLPILVNGGKPF